MKTLMRRFFVRDDPEYEALVQKYQATTLVGKLFYLFMHVVPGLLAYRLINVPPVHAAGLRVTGWSEAIYQGTCLVGFLMQWRKNLYPLIAFHFLVNIVWGAILGAVLK
jgi:hypothetical protein